MLIFRENLLEVIKEKRSLKMKVVTHTDKKGNYLKKIVTVEEH